MKAREWDEFKEANPRFVNSFSECVNIVSNYSLEGLEIRSTGVKHLMF